MKTAPRPNPNTDLDPNHPLFRLSQFRFLPLLVLILLVMNLLATCSNSRAVQMAAQHQPIIYVQTPEGTTVSAKPVDPLYRSEQVNAEFAGDWLQLAYTWKLPTEKGKASVSERGIDFPYQFHAASLAIEPGYREAYMDSEAKKYSRQFPFGNYISGQNQSYIRIYSKKVVPVRFGLCDVMIVATRVHARGDTILAQEIFNRVIRQKAISPANSSLKLWGGRDTHLGQLLTEMQHQGLQIVQISDF